MDGGNENETVVLEGVVGDREPWVPLLLEADESEAVVRAYLSEGELFAIRQGDRIVGGALVLNEGDEFEIKNFAVLESERDKGYGSAAVAAIADHARTAGAVRLVVGSADVAAAANRFYVRAGFSRIGLRVGFFDDYPEPLFEDGVQLHDMVLYGMDL